MNNIPKLAVITGASSGIGAEYSNALAKAGYNLLITARRKDRLAKLKSELESKYSIDIKVVVADLSTKSGMDLVLSNLDENLKIDLLINNAGFGYVKRFEDTDPDNLLKMLDLNCKAPMYITRKVYQRMLAQKSGKIINVCSTAAFQPVPYMTVYSATKAFLYNFSESLNAEAALHGVQVIAHCPGPTESEFHIAAGLSTKIDALPGMQAEKVVNDVLAVLPNNSTHQVVNGTLNKLLSICAKVLPVRLSARISERVLRKYVTKR